MEFLVFGIMILKNNIIEYFLQAEFESKYPKKSF